MDVQRLIELLPRGLYDGDAETTRVLESMLGPVGSVDNYFTAKTRGLSQLLDPSQVPDAMVPHLAALVGVGLELPAANAASVGDLRKLIPVAVSLWKAKGTRPSWRSLAAGLAGSRSLILDWFYLRTVSGSPSRVAVIPGPGGTGFPYSTPEYVTDLWVMDPTGSSVNLELLARFLDVVRPAGERINLYRALLVDDLGAGSLWADAGAGGSVSYDRTAQELTVSDGGAVYADLDGLDSSWASYHTTARWALTGSAGWRFRVTGTTYYSVDVDQASGAVQLHRWVSGVPTLLASTTVPPLVAAHPYLWAFEAWEGSSSTTLRVYLEGAKLVDVVDSTGGRPSSGGVAWGTAPGATATLSTCLIWPEGISPTRIGPNP